MTYEVGKFYLVPCVRGEWSYTGNVREWPVMGRLHEDAEIIKFQHPHYHIDFRFVAAHLLPYDDGIDAFRGGLTMLQHQYACPLMTWPRFNKGGLPAPVMRRRKCHREHSLPFDARPISWLPRLEKAHAGCKLAGGPHLPASGLRPVQRARSA